MNICSIIAKNYVAHARVLAQSFRQVDPEGTVTVLVVDDHAGYLNPDAEPFELLGIGDVGIPDVAAMAAAYDVTELSTAVKPWLLRHLLARDGVDAVTYLDPDIMITDSIAEVAELASEHGIVLTPHFVSPLPRDGLRPSEEDILIAGTYNLGFISLGAGADSERLLDWWSERLEHDCVVDPGNGRFVDQRWIDLAPGIWPGLRILRDPGYNVAYWNLPSRRLRSDGDAYLVDGEPLRFFHFSGFDPRRPDALSKHQNRIEVSHEPALARICGEYAGRLLANGYEEARGWPYGWEQMPNGLSLDRPARRVYRQLRESGDTNGSVFERHGAERFAAHLREVPPGQRFSRYARALRDTRPDLLASFPDLDGRDAAGFEHWLEQSADSGPLAPQRQLLGPARYPAGAASANGSATLGINLAGYLSSELGVGEAARQVALALEVGGVPTSQVDVPVEESQLAQAFRMLEPADHPHAVNLICVNADMLPAVVRAAPRRLFEGRPTAGLWFWEVERFPERWRDSFNHLDEVWVASEFVAESLRRLAPIPVRTITVPVTPGEPSGADRAALGMPDGFCFLYVFDYRSVFRRKNPLAAVEAFCRAFEPGSGASLLIKTAAAASDPERAAELAAAVADRPEIQLIDGVLSAADKNAMIANCDAYVSLHRSEGLGLTMAEAMYFGRPVIATAYSGNLDFMTAENSYLVEYDLGRIGPGAPPYPETAHWAEPRVEHAAELMRAVFEDREDAAARAARAAADIRAGHSPAAAGRVLQERLAVIGRQAVAAPPPSPQGAPTTQREHLHNLLRADQIMVSGETRRLRRFAKRVYMRALRPYAAHQRRIDVSVGAAVDELGVEVGALERRAGAASEAVADRIGEQQGRLEAHLRALDAELGVARAEQEARLVELQAKVEAAGRTAPLEAELARLSAKVERLGTDAEGSLEDLRARVEQAEALVRAAAAEPYMADDRLAPRRHPQLGDVIGFDAPAGGAETGGYRGFEDLFRGPEEKIRERQRVYLPLVAASGPILDAGCGRGEFLDLMREAGVEARGVDLDPGMVDRCREKGHDVECVNLLEALAATEPDSLGCIFSAQVIEHLETDDLRRFLELSVERLRPGGKLIVETVNPHSAEALKCFWVDPTHQRPLFPETVLALSQLAGFASADAFCPLGKGDWDADRRTTGEYAVVATVA